MLQKFQRITIIPSSILKFNQYVLLGKRNNMSYYGFTYYNLFSFRKHFPDVSETAEHFIASTLTIIYTVPLYSLQL